MAELIDEPVVEQEVEQVTDEMIGKLEDIETESKEEVAVEQAQPEPEDDLPEKYRGKSASEIAKMHQEAERALGRQSSEVGELRKVFDEYIQNSVQSTNEVKPQDSDPVDFFVDPDKAVQRAIENHPKLKQAEAVAAEMKKHQAMSKLKSEYPDIESTLTDPKFAEWVKASPIRQQLYRNADKAYDYDSAAELMSNWNERKGVVAQTLEVEKQAQKNDVKNASTGTARSNPDARSNRKVYRRSDIIRLMKEDPARYDALQPELMKAYAEGRVK